MLVSFEIFHLEARTHTYTKKKDCLACRKAIQYFHCTKRHKRYEKQTNPGREKNSKYIKIKIAFIRLYVYQKKVKEKKKREITYNHRNKHENQRFPESFTLQLAALACFFF